MDWVAFDAYDTYRTLLSATAQNVLVLRRMPPLAKQGRAAREFFRGSEFTNKYSPRCAPSPLKGLRAENAPLRVDGRIRQKASRHDTPFWRGENVGSNPWTLPDA